MKKGISIVFLILLSLLTAKAGVDLRTGTFYMTYTDMAFTNSKAEVSRNYNSGNNKAGIFGFGWNSFLETKLAAMPDGTVVLNWWGNTLGDYYEPATINRAGLYNMVNSIIKNLVSTDKLDNNPVAIAEKKSFYLINNKERAQKYIELQLAKSEPLFIPASAAKTWVLDVNQSITWDGKKFIVKSWDDRYEFNEKGQLTFNFDRSYNMQLLYAGDRLNKLVIDGKQTCRVETDSSGKVVRLLYDDGATKRTAIFAYDSAHNLLYSKDAGDNEYWYSYDRYHNMTRIRYADASFIAMEYDAGSFRIIRFRESNGSFKTYQYPYFYSPEGRINYNHYATRVQQFDSTGTLTFTHYKEYENRIKDDGSSYLHRLLEQTDTSYHEVLYAPEIGNASYRKKNNKEAWAAYDSKHRPSYLHINDSIYKSSYNVMDLPSYFLAKDSLSTDSIQYEYKYDGDGRLTEVWRNEQQYKLLYHDSGHVTEIISPDGSSFGIEEAADSSVVLHDGSFGEMVLSAKEWQSLNDSLAAVRKTAHAATRNEAPVEISTRRQKMLAAIEMQEKKQKERNSQKDDPAKKKQEAPGQEAAQNVMERRKKILSNYYSLSDLLSPKKIAHEWIWERM